MTTVTAEQVKQVLCEALQTQDVVVEDTSGGCGSSFEVHVISGQFQGKPLLARHRLVNEALKDLMPSIHALSIKKAAPPAATAPQPAA